MHQAPPRRRNWFAAGALAAVILATTACGGAISATRQPSSDAAPGGSAGQRARATPSRQPTSSPPCPSRAAHRKRATTGKQFGPAWSDDGPQRLRHPQRHPRPGPQSHNLQARNEELHRPDRHPGRSVHGHHHRLHPRQQNQQRGPDRPRRCPERRVAEGRPAPQQGTADRLRQRSPQPAGRVRPRQPAKVRRRRRHLAAAAARPTAARTSRGRFRSRRSTSCG